jgi:DNA-directed RNA polymerase specialized sigma24 family protein
VTTSARGAAAGEGLAVPRRVVAPEALEEFHRRFFMPLVRRAAWKHGLSKEDARDVVQEAFLLAVVKLDPDGNPKSWLIGVVDHLSINLQRKTVRRAKLATKWGFQPESGEPLYADFGGGLEDDFEDKA